MNKDSSQTTPACKLFDALQNGCPLRLFESRTGNKVEVVGTVTPDTSTTAFWDVLHPTDDEPRRYPGSGAPPCQGERLCPVQVPPQEYYCARGQLGTAQNNGPTGIPTVDTTVTYPNGAAQYKGQWDEAAHQPHGRGTLVLSNGRTYEGNWVDGKLHGHGTLTNATKTVTYTGQWRDHMKHGRGEERINEERYVGQFELNERHGTGNVAPDNRSTVYEGEWKAGERDGDGTSYWNVEGVNTKRYEGGWKDGERHGQGIAYDAIDGKAVKAYEGEWQNGDRHGLGIFYDTEEGTPAKVYSGEWANGYRTNQGTAYGYALPDGTVPKVCEGGWNDDNYAALERTSTPAET